MLVLWLSKILPSTVTKMLAYVQKMNIFAKI